MIPGSLVVGCVRSKMHLEHVQQDAKVFRNRAGYFLEHLLVSSIIFHGVSAFNVVVIITCSTSAF